MNKFQKLFINHTPELLKNYYIQNKLKISYDLPKDYKFRLASSSEDFKNIGTLIYNRYVDSGLERKNKKHSRLNLFQGLPNSAVLIMEKAEKNNWYSNPNWGQCFWSSIRKNSRH